MVLGIFLHASNVYSPQPDWLIADSETSEVFDWINSAIHAFRMPAFFWISGYFCALTLDRYGPRTFVRKRLPRIGIPLLAAWGTLNVLQVIVLSMTNGESVGAALSNGAPLYHLWFLVDLLVYFLVAVLLAWPLAFHARALIDRIGVNVGPIVLIAMLSVASVTLNFAVRASGFAYADLLGLTTLFRLGESLPFFLAGLIMYISSGMRSTFLQVPPVLLWPAIALAVVVDRYSVAPSWLTAELIAAISILAAWVSVASVIGLFGRLFGKGGRVPRFLADASYSIYLFHHLIVFLLALLLLNVAWASYAKYCIVVVLTFWTCVFIHRYAISRNRWARFAFNGRWESTTSIQAQRPPQVDSH